MEDLAPRVLCAEDDCYRAPVRGSRYCAPHRRKARAVIDAERLPRSVAPDKSITNLYAITAGNEAVKFGYAANLPKRLVLLQTGNHLHLTVAAHIRCHPEVEGRIHAYLKRGHMKGEWFTLNEKSLGVIHLMRKNNLAALIYFLNTDEGVSR